MGAVSRGVEEFLGRIDRYIWVGSEGLYVCLYVCMSAGRQIINTNGKSAQRLYVGIHSFPFSKYLKTKSIFATTISKQVLLIRFFKTY